MFGIYIFLKGRFRLLLRLKIMIIIIITGVTINIIFVLVAIFNSVILLLNVNNGLYNHINPPILIVRSNFLYLNLIKNCLSKMQVLYCATFKNRNSFNKTYYWFINKVIITRVIIFDLLRGAFWVIQLYFQLDCILILYYFSKNIFQLYMYAKI